MDHRVTAIFDANILYPAPLRDLFIRIAQAGMVRAKWTETIHDEWTRNLLLNHPQISPAQLNRTRNLMNDAVRDCLVTGYEDLIDSIQLPDPNDSHVLAAAIRCGADVIVTFNLKDFPKETMARFDIEALHPDEFLSSLFDLTPEIFCSVVKIQRVSLRNPCKTPEELLNSLDNQGLSQTVSRLRPRMNLL